MFKDYKKIFLLKNNIINIKFFKIIVVRRDRSCELAGKKPPILVWNKKTKIVIKFYRRWIKKKKKN